MRASASGSMPILEPAVSIAVLWPGIHGRGYAPSRCRRNPAVHMQFLVVPTFAASRHYHAVFCDPFETFAVLYVLNGPWKKARQKGGRFGLYRRLRCCGIYLAKDKHSSLMEEEP
jgi:hypothetical protein